ncbi:hypothetical protein FJU08_11630 [Martelella alba]|uniref:Uncharacterized protein n=1 Tax=Martelella alba TaxID=2590451 RepID=A0A506U7J1_9HYPH|nr:hypothetical protein [Martelella alba]TPW30323.1 hypothetical protein FJU08_11630 [Martelella alba]
MSGVVEDAESRREWEDYRNFLERLVECDDIGDKTAEGITKLVIDKGVDVLSEKQRYIFERHVESRFPQPCCTQCGELIPWADAYEHIHSPGRCASCEHSYQRFMDED